MKKTGIIIVAASILAAVGGASYFLMGGKKTSTDVDTGYSKGHRVVASNVNPVPSGLKENYFGGKRTKKRKSIKKCSSHSRSNLCRRVDKTIQPSTSCLSIVFCKWK